MDHNLSEVLTAIGVLGTIAAGVILFTKTITDYSLKKRMVEKGLVGDDASQLLKNHTDSRFSSLKWGLIILFGGLGLILLESIQYDRYSTLPYGVFAVSVSVGFLLYYFIVKRISQD